MFAEGSSLDLYVRRAYAIRVANANNNVMYLISNLRFSTIVFYIELMDAYKCIKVIFMLF